MLVNCDANALEWRVPVSLSRDPVGIDELMQKRDIHTANQNEFNLPTRLISKKYLFRTIFRGSGWAFANDPEFSNVSDDPDYWDSINDRFYKKYKGLNKWHTHLSTFVTAHQPIIGTSGRSWFIPMQIDKRGNPRIPWQQLTNYPVQGTAADIMAVARVSLSNKLKKEKIDAIPVSTVHDSLAVDTTENNVDKVAMLMYTSFDDLPANFKKLFGFDLIIPFPCEVKVGRNMKEMTELKRENINGY